MAAATSASLSPPSARARGPAPRHDSSSRTAPSCPPLAAADTAASAQSAGRSGGSALSKQPSGASKPAPAANRSAAPTPRQPFTSSAAQWVGLPCTRSRHARHTDSADVGTGRSRAGAHLRGSSAPCRSEDTLSGGEVVPSDGGQPT
eukprot:68525-Chlamydomonas_euryale.AAC.1